MYSQNGARVYQTIKGSCSWWWSRPLGHLVVYLCVGMLAGMCYLNSLTGDFVHDDIVAITTNPDVLGKTSLSHVFQNDFWGKPMADASSHKSYRPLTVLTFRWNMHIGEGSVFGFHLVNVILHVVVTLLFTYTCLDVLMWSHESSATAGLFFACHPVHTEAVSSIVGRAELLSGMFFFLSFIAFHKSGKEIGNFKWPGLDKYTLTIVSMLSILVSFRVWILNGSLPQFSEQDNPAAFSQSLLSRLLTYCYLTTFNVGLLLFPACLSYDWQMGSIPLVESLLDPRNLVTLSSFTGLAVITHFATSSPKNNETKTVTIALATCVISFLPASNLLVTVGFVVAERVLYIPSAGFFILVVHGLQKLKSTCPKSIWACRCFTLAILAIFVLKTTRRNNVWSSREALFRSGLESVPQNAKVHYNFANLQKDLGEVDLAVKHYRIAISLWSDHASAHNNLGTLLSEPTEAERHFKTALSINPLHARAYFNLANLYSKQDKKPTAESFWKRAIQLEPNFAEAYSSLASLYAQTGRSKEAEKLHLTALRISPDNVDALNNYGVFLQSLGRIDEALQHYQRALQIQPNHTVTLLNAARTLRSLKCIEDAESLYKRALQIQSDPQVLDNLGILYIKSGRLQEARQVYRQLFNQFGQYQDGKIHYAQLLLQERSFEEAESALLSVIKGNQSFYEAYHQLAILYTHINRSAEGLERILQAIKLCSTTKTSCAQLYVCHGDILKDLKDLNAAAQSYNLAVQIDPKIAHAHLNLGVIHHLQGRYNEALKHYQSAQNLDPYNPVVVENMKKLKKQVFKSSPRECVSQSATCWTC
ncbi:protein O-mannosyl-transferase TMTC1-like isoform X2 [Tachypleus tridentatus]|uniref:protein O-mannosyl-transferase TMTC1-like isoform X2 n=1 Tax=Tachypleus tridentatus TaxID=6853 RepID=UPI003FD35312